MFGLLSVAVVCGLFSMKKLLFLLILGAVFVSNFFTTGCQTMATGKGEDIYISVDQPNSRIYLNDVLLSASSYATIRLNKSGGPYKITARKIGYLEKEVKVTSKWNWRQTGVAFLDNIFGVIKMGSFVFEAATGGLKQLDAHGIRLELTPVTAQAQPPRLSATEDTRLDPVGDLKRWRAAGNKGYPPSFGPQ